MRARSALVAIAAGLVFAAHAQFVPPIVTQKSVANGVTVAVTAGNLGPATPVWDFAVVLRSDRGDLPDDLAEAAVLVDEHGHVHRAITWEGAPAAGDHRGGVLKFFAVEPRPRSLELRIVRRGEAQPRTFSWALGSGMVAMR